jgi:uncharacterized protein (TIGR02246 family)
MRKYLRVSFVLSVALVAGFAGVRGLMAQDGAVRAAIEAGNKKFVNGAAKGDASLIASAYTSDAEAFPPNSDVVRGRPAIEKLWKSVLDSGINGFELVTTEVASQGNLAYEVGTYVMKMKDGKVADRGKYCVVWKKVNGRWLLHRDICSTNLPEAKK